MVERTSAHAPPGDEVPSEEASPEETPTDENQGEEVPTDEAPTDEVPSEEASLDEVPSEEASPEEVPTEEVPADDAEEDDWGEDDDDDDWGEEEEEDDWDGQVIIEDASDDPDAELEERVEQVEVKGDSGEIRGVVKDARTGDPLMGANVRALETPYEVTTDADGAYVLNLPEGVYTLEFFYETFSVKEVADLEVQLDGTRTQSVELVPLAGMVSETVIEAEAPKGNESVVLTERAEAVETKDVMSSQEMKKAGGGSSASLARFIVGATLEDNRYLIIRGLKHRYGNTLFDGARLPSPDPDVRTVPLDIFPSGALSSIDIVKSFTPEQPADFVGGSTQLRSRDIPDDFTFDVSAAVEANTQATFGDFVRDSRLRGDGLGFGNISRGLPKGFPGTDAPPVAGPAYTPEEIEAYGEALYTATPSATSMAPPTYRLSTTLGNGHTLANGDRIGWVMSGGIKDEYKTVEGVSASAIDCRGCPNEASDMMGTMTETSGLKAGTDWGSTGPGSDRRYTRRVQLGGIGLAKYTSERGHEVFANLFYSRDAANEVRYQRGFSPKAIGPEAALTSRHRYVMRSIFFTQLGASHEFEKANGLILDYSG
ncbi:MAG: TonB-dependent receptor, partial [Nannocystaceae bacterium]